MHNGISESFNEAAGVGKQMLPGGSKENSALQHGYFEQVFKRVFDGEAYSEAVEQRRRYRKEQSKKNISERTFLPSQPEKKRYNQQSLPSLSLCPQTPLPHFRVSNQPFADIDSVTCPWISVINLLAAILSFCLSSLQLKREPYTTQYVIGLSMYEWMNVYMHMCIRVLNVCVCVCVCVRARARAHARGGGGGGRLLVHLYVCVFVCLPVFVCVCVLCVCVCKWSVDKRRRLSWCKDRNQNILRDC